MTDERVDGCPCGLTGVDCTDLASPLLDFEGAMNETCFESGFKECKIERNAASCICRCGFDGEFCESEAEPLILNFIGSVLLGVFCVGFSVIVLMRRYQKLRSDGRNTGYDYTLQELASYRFESFPLWAILLFRLTMAVVVFIPVFVSAFVKLSLRNSMATFTLWNWLMFGIIFGCGSWLTMKAMIWPNTRNENSGFFGVVYVVCLEVGIPVSIVISAINWLLLVPEALDNGVDDVLTARSYTTHGAVVFILFVEFFLNNVYYAAHHVLYIVIWTAIYGTTHGLFMFGDEINNFPHCPIYGFAAMDDNFYLVRLLLLLFVFSMFYFLIFGLSQLKRKLAGKPEHEKFEKPEKIVSNRERLTTVE